MAAAPHFKVIYQNIQCLNSKKINCIENSTTISKNPQVLCISEHWQCQESIETIKIRDYSLASSFCRSQHKNGGSAIFIINGIDFKERLDITNMSIECNIELSAVEILDPKILICSVYRPPNANNDVFLLNLELLLTKLTENC